MFLMSYRFVLFPSLQISYTFLCDEWLADDKGSCRRYAIFIPSHKEQIRSNTLFKYLTKAKMFDNMMALSVLWRPSYSIFNRTQRFCCLISGFFLSITISAMWFDTDTSADEYEVTIGFVSVNYKQVYVGVIGTLLIFPLIAILNLLFRYRNMKVNVDNKKLAHIKQDGCLPHWVNYIGYSICLMTIIAGSVVTTLYSLQWGSEISNDWLMSIYFGVVTDLTIGPVQVRNISCLKLNCCTEIIIFLLFIISRVAERLITITVPNMPACPFACVSIR